uniref:Uncharacterized protein n=1 Tax=Oryza brachyantha TaxID=4533 RepID=J3LCJ0_ORYBR
MSSDRSSGGAHGDGSGSGGGNGNNSGDNGNNFNGGFVEKALLGVVGSWVVLFSTPKEDARYMFDKMPTRIGGEQEKFSTALTFGQEGNVPGCLPKCGYVGPTGTSSPLRVDENVDVLESGHVLMGPRSLSKENMKTEDGTVNPSRKRQRCAMLEKRIGQRKKFYPWDLVGGIGR